MADIRKQNFLRAGGNILCLLAFALLANLLVSPGITLAERHLELNLAAAGAGVGLGLLWLARRLREHPHSVPG